MPNTLGKSTDLIKWDEQGLPHSIVFDDKYFCSENGYEEIIYVSCEGNALRERFLTLNPSLPGTFTIIETGFGTGLNFCSAWQIWESCAPPQWKLHYISVELYPIEVEDLNRALKIWSILSKYREALVDQYKPLKEGIDRLSFDGGRIQLTLVFEDVVHALARIKNDAIAPGGADAWFLSGFAPSKNPKMWSDQVFEGMSQLSHRGTTLSTFTVAGFVRRGLEANGFVVKKIRGYGEKKHILTGFFNNLKAGE